MSQPSCFARLGFAIALMLGAVAAYSAPTNTIWLTNFTISAKGGHIIGNPAAPTKVIEYASYTCGHCANFETNDAPLFKNQYVATGKVSFEIRNLVRDPLDLTAAMLARCGGKGRFFGNHKHLMATQATWMEKASAISKTTEGKLKAKDYIGFMQGAYGELGLTAIMQQRGVTVAQGKTCLADKAALKLILDMTDEATGPLGMNSTPSFMINGKVDEDVHSFESLKSKLP
jgi:protein-disulfide isomerase